MASTYSGLRRRAIHGWALAVALAGGCYTGASLEQSTAEDADDGGVDPDDTPGNSDDHCQGEQSGLFAAPMRRLTAREYENSVRDLLGDWATVNDSFPPDEVSAGFRSNSVASVTRPHVEAYMRAAESLAESSLDHLHELLPCDPSNIGQQACAEAFIDALARRAYRRPVADQERVLLVQLFATGAADGFEEGIRLVLEGVLTAPQFLYRLEPAFAEEAWRPLTDHELATRLSYFLWQSMPDDALDALADAGALDDHEQLETQARRMLADPRASEFLAAFHRQWLGLESESEIVKDLTLYPEYSAQLGSDMVRETELVSEFVFRHGGGIEALLTTDLTFVSPELAALYGAEPATDFEAPSSWPSLPSGFFAARVDPEQRSGVLTHASLLSTLAKHNQTAPVDRGAFVLRNLLCVSLPEPPDDIELTPPELDPNATAREQYDQHSSDPACAGCHRIIDPVGFGFEGYDAIGRFRVRDSFDNEIDASGEVILDGAPVAFDGAVELAQLLAARDAVEDCAMRQWVRFALGRHEAPTDACVLEGLADAWQAADGDIQELVVAIVLSSTFRHR